MAYAADGYTCPDLADAPGALLCVPIPLIPFFRRFFADMQRNYTWRTREDWYNGYQAFAQMEETLMAGCLRDLVESNDRIYRLLDTALNGTFYSSTPDPETEQPIIIPPIPTTPPGEVTSFLALRAQVARLRQLAENAATGAQFGADSALDGTVSLDYDGSWRARLEAVQGIINAGWFGNGGQPTTLADLYASLRIGKSQDSSSIQNALDLLSAASNVASIFSVVKDLLTETVETGLEGATLGTLIAASIANAAAQGLLASKLDRVIAALDGGGLVAPTSNVLERLTNIDGNLEP